MKTWNWEEDKMDDVDISLDDKMRAFTKRMKEKQAAEEAAEAAEAAEVERLKKAKLLNMECRRGF